MDFQESTKHRIYNLDKLLQEDWVLLYFLKTYTLTLYFFIMKHLFIYNSSTIHLQVIYNSSTIHLQFIYNSFRVTCFYFSTPIQNQYLSIDIPNVEGFDVLLDLYHYCSN